MEEDNRLSEESLERLSERLVDRIENLNAYMIEKLGNQIVDIGTFTPSQVREILQSVKYGNDLDEIINKIADVTEMNVKDIYDIFEEVAKKNQSYAKQFYEYQNANFIPYEQNKALQDQVKSIATATANEYINMSKTFAYMRYNNRGIKEYTKISDIYQKITDEAILSVAQGRDSYDMAMRKAMKEMTSRGLRTVDYSTGYSRRADSSVRMNIMDGIRRLNKELQEQFGKEFGADGVEVSHHKNAAPDHIDTVDGKQFSTRGDVTVNGIKYKDYDTVNNSLDRHVGELNCYHFTYQIVLGVSEPMYSKEQLEDDKKANENGFEFEGKHYTNYEGTQLQRQIETKIRQYKDRQIGARAVNDTEEVYNCQEKIRQFTSKYNDLHKASGLPTKVDRLRVDGYRKLNIDKSLFNDNIITNDFKSKNKKIETMIIYDMKTRKKLYTSTSNKRNTVGDLKAYTMFATSKPNSLATAHNHPSNTSFSKKDIMTFNKFKSIDSLFVETDEYTYYLTKNNVPKIKSENLDKTVTDIRKIYYNKYGKTKDSMHLVNKIISEKIGWNYGRIKK